MQMARSFDGGEAVEVERRGRKQRATADEIHAAVDLLTLEWRCLRWSQRRIAGILHISQQHVSQRLQKLPAPFHEAVSALVAKHPDGIPPGVRARVEKGLVEWRRDRRERARAGSGS